MSVNTYQNKGNVNLKTWQNIVEMNQNNLEEAYRPSGSFRITAATSQC